MLPKQHEFLKAPNNFSHTQFQALSKPKISKECFQLFFQKRTKEIPTNISVFSASGLVWYQNLDLCQWGKAKNESSVGFFPDLMQVQPWRNSSVNSKNVYF